MWVVILTLFHACILSLSVSHCITSQQPLQGGKQCTSCCWAADLVEACFKCLLVRPQACWWINTCCTLSQHFFPRSHIPLYTTSQMRNWTMPFTLAPQLPGATSSKKPTLSKLIYQHGAPAQFVASHAHKYEQASKAKMETHTLSLLWHDLLKWARN